MLDKALDVAHQADVSNFKRPQQVGAVIVNKRGRILSIGTNKSKTHPLQARYAKRAKRDSKIFLHAELDALVKCRGTPHTIYVARVRQDVGTGLAKPCPICMAAIEESGIKRIVYTKDNFGFGVIDL